MLRIFTLVLSLVLLAAGSARAASPAPRLIVEAEYFADSRNDEAGLVHGKFPLERPVRPFRSIAGRLMAYADDPGATLRIEAEGVALGTLYDFMRDRMRLRHLRFTGATIEGRVSLSSKAAAKTCAARFEGTIAPRRGAIIVGAWDYRESPQRAPFPAAVAEPGSFIDALAAIMAVIYGPAPLSAASADSDDAVARAARMALEGRTGVDCVTP